MTALPVRCAQTGPLFEHDFQSCTPPSGFKKTVKPSPLLLDFRLHRTRSATGTRCLTKSPKPATTTMLMARAAEFLAILCGPSRNWRGSTRACRSQESHGASSGAVLNAPMLSSVEVAATSETYDFGWLREGCHWEMASKTILAVTEAN